MKRYIAVAAMAAMGVSSGAAAQSFKSGYPQTYVGADAMFWRAKTDFLGTTQKLDSTALRLVAGIKLDDYLAVEFHGARGGSDDFLGEKTKLGHLISGFVKGIVPMGNSARLYGLLGYSELKLSYDNFENERDDGISFGGGLELDITESIGISGDLIRYLSPSEYDFDAASVGVRYRF